MAWSLRVKTNFASLYVWKYINLSDRRVLKWFSNWDIFCSEVFGSNVRYSYDTFAHRHEGKPHAIISKSCTFVSLCQRHVMRAWWIFPQPLILCIFGTTFTWGDILIAPTHFTSCTKSLWNSHYIGDLCLSVCGWCMHATHACHASLPIHMIRTLYVCSCSLLPWLLFCFFLNKDLSSQRLHLLSQCCGPRSITCLFYYL